MHERLEHWDEAETLAERLEPSLLPRLLFKHGLQLEKEQKHVQALDKFNQVTISDAYLCFDTAVHRPTMRHWDSRSHQSSSCNSSRSVMLVLQEC